MASSTREEIAEVLDGLDELQDRLCALSFDGLTTPEWMALLEREERRGRRHPVPRHALINLLATQATKEELGGKLDAVMANRLRITRQEARRRITDAADLGERRALTGQPLAPRLTATAHAQRDGRIGEEHVRIIQKFFTALPQWIDAATQEAVEANLAKKASRHTPEQLITVGQELMNELNPDGNYTDDDRARKRGITIGKQGSDLMSRISGYLDPELRATLEPVLAKLAAPGAGNPEDQTPVLEGEPDDAAAKRDTRSKAQRIHDGLLAGLRALVDSGKLGRHRGLPVSIVATVTLKDLEAAAGYARTGGGSRLPMTDLIRMASHGAHHYLAIFDDAKPLALYHTKRLASPAQRMMLYGKERGCTRPDCTVPAYHSEVHHVQAWAATHRTDIDDLTLACGPDNRLAEKGWTTRKNARGETEWIPPAHLDHGQPRVNNFHHPEKLLVEEDDDDDDIDAA